MNNNSILTQDIYKSEQLKHQKIPVLSIRLSAGFPSPGDDYIENKLDLNEFLIKNPSATYFVKAEGNSMAGAGINSGDMLIVDRSLKASDNDIVIATLYGELAVKRIRMHKDAVYLIAENPGYRSARINPETDFEIWGVVTYVIHKV